VAIESPPFAESVVGPCADVPTPPSARPGLLIRGAVHPAVRDLQRRLNDIHARRFLASLPGIDKAPLLEDCIFGKDTFAAVLSLQRIAFPGNTAEHDGKVGPHTWAALDAAAIPLPLPPGPVPPAPVPVPPVPPSFTPPSPPSPPITGIIWRTCCLLESGSLSDPSAIGPHTANGGIVYSGKGGFLDLAHIRDVADLSGRIYQQIHAASGASGTAISTTLGNARLTSTVPPVEWTEVAGAIAFDEGLAHEIDSYATGHCRDTIPVPGLHNSSFSPEDLTSNRLGTIAAQRALNAGGTWGTEVERQIAAIFTALDAQPIAETRRAFGLISGRWVDPTAMVPLAGLPGNCYLRRRNFTFNPWKTGHPSDAPTPAFVTAPFTFSSSYDYTHTSNRTFSKSGFAAEIAAVKADARTTYGPNFDSP
jgi:hypothetical protein